VKLIVGLGNPGKKYEKTRHNSGFMAIDFYVEQKGLQYKEKFNGLYAETTVNNEKYILLKPQTYMNLSGICVRKFSDYYNIDETNIFIIYDDVNFKVGEFKIRRNGSAGGHNGMKNIIENLNTENIKRIKIGIDKNNIPLEDYVLKKFSTKDLSTLNELYVVISNIIDDMSKYNIDELMQKYNGISNE
jgi:PTH1 family peptidyl-tRNA hydrolase